MEFQHPMFTRNGVRNLKEIKRGNQPKKHDHEEAMDGAIEEGADASASGPVVKKARHDYSAFKTDVARLQQNLDAFEADLKEHTMQVQLKLSCTPAKREPSERHVHVRSRCVTLSVCCRARVCRHSLRTRRLGNGWQRGALRAGVGGHGTQRRAQCRTVGCSAAGSRVALSRFQ